MSRSNSNHFIKDQFDALDELLRNSKREEKEAAVRDIDKSISVLVKQYRDNCTSRGILTEISDQKLMRLNSDEIKEFQDQIGIVRKDIAEMKTRISAIANEVRLQIYDPVVGEQVGMNGMDALTPVEDQLKKAEDKVEKVKKVRDYTKQLAEQVPLILAASYPSFQGPKPKLGFFERILKPKPPSLAPSSNPKYNLAVRESGEFVAELKSILNGSSTLDSFASNLERFKYKPSSEFKDDERYLSFATNLNQRLARYKEKIKGAIKDDPIQPSPKSPKP